jgi:hypothetical protein
MDMLFMMCAGGGDDKPQINLAPKYKYSIPSAKIWWLKAWLKCTKGSRSSKTLGLPSLCVGGTQMVQVTKVYHENTKVLISDKIAYVAKIFMIDEACVPPIEDNTYIFWSTRHLVAKGV